MSKVKRSLYLKDFYRSYVIRMKGLGLEPKRYLEYRKIMLTMGEVMSDILLEDGILALPWKIGDVFFKETDFPERPQADFQASRKAKKFVPIVNTHNEHIIYNVFWLSPERAQKKRKMWCFSLLRGTNRRSAVLMKKGKTYPDFKMLMK